MSAPHSNNNNNEQEEEGHPSRSGRPEEQFIDPDSEIYDVIEDDGDVPMDEDSDDEGQQQEEAPRRVRRLDNGMEVVVDETMNPGEMVFEEVEGAEPEFGMDEGGEGEGEDEEQVEDNSLGHSAHHNPSNSIFSVSLHPSFPNPPLAVSGGEDDLAYIFSPIPSSSTSTSTSFNSETFQPIKLTGHADSVVATGFSADGTLVASGGMDGKVRVWRRIKGKSSAAAAVSESEEPVVQDWHSWEFLTSLDTGDEIVWLTWHPKGNVLAAGCNDSTVWMWQLPSGNTMQVFSSHTETCTSGAFTPSGKLLLTTSADASLCVWDPRQPTPLLKLTPTSTAQYGSFAEGGITAMAISPASNLVAIGGANGQIRIINLPAGNVVGVLAGHAEGESIEGLEFLDLLGLAGPNGEAGGTRGLVLASCATDSKCIIWDVTTCNPRVELKHQDVITSVKGHPAPHRHLISTASADKTVKTWDARTGKLLGEWKGHRGVVNDLKVAKAPKGWEGEEDGEVVVTAGDDGAVLIWKA